MLKQPLKLVENQTHEELFLERYDHLMKWALHMAGGDRQVAEDLLQEAFVQFTVSRPPLSGIKNAEAYIYGILRHLHLAYVRNAANQQWHQFSLLECDSAEIGLRKGNVLNDLQVRDELREICEFACFRKETSKAASVLILRFFHGYYPREIADVLNNSIQTVKVWLHTARAEAKTHLKDPDKIRFLKAEKPKQVSGPHQVISSSETSAVLSDLRHAIFSAISGEHLPGERLAELYGKTTDEIVAALSVGELAHLVSCATCLDQVNTTLDLPLLADRYPTDMIGKDSNRNDGDGSGHSLGYDGGDGPGGSKGPDAGNLLRKRAREVFEHFPRELQVGINGYIQTAQKINSSESEFSLSLGEDEPISFIEIFGGQQTRLMLMPVISPPPEGPLEQCETIGLSENRRLDVHLVFGSPKPTLQVLYSDPTFVPDDVQARFADLNLSEINQLSSDSVKDAVLVHTSQTETPPTVVNEDTFDIGFTALLGSDTPPPWFDLRSWLNPFRLTIGFAALLITLGLIYLYQPTTTPLLTAELVIDRARKVEVAMTASDDKAVHRNYQIEEWSSGSLRSRKRIDQWTKTGASAERVYDEAGKMIAGEWLDKDVRRVFKQGQKLVAVETETRPVDKLYSPEPTVIGFTHFVRSFEPEPTFSLEDAAKTYTITYKKEPDVPANLLNKLLVASLTVDRETYNPVSQTIVLQIGEEIREYRISDVRVEQKPLTSLSPLIFLPEEELLRGATKVIKPLEITVPAPVLPPTIDTATASNTASSVPATASLETEVEVFRALDSVNALSGDQVGVTRLADGRLRVTGIVDSASRKIEILNALNPIRGSNGLTIDIQTGSEAASRTKQNISGDNITLDSVTAQVEQSLAVEPELRDFFAKKGITGDELNAGIRNYSGAVLDRSRALRRNALALKQLAERFSPAEIEQLEPVKRNQWKALLRSKAGAVASDVRSLDSQLYAIGLSASSNGSGGDDIRDASDLTKAAQRLFGLAAACDSQVGQSFSISGGSKGSATVKTVQFWRNLRQMADIAAEIQKF